MSELGSLPPADRARVLADAARLNVHIPQQGWGLAVRGAKYSMPAAVQQLLSEFFDEGAAPGSRGKVSPSTAKLRLSRALPAVSLIGLTVEIITSYFGRRCSGHVGPFSITAAADEQLATEDPGGEGEEVAAPRVKRVRRSSGGGGGGGGGGSSGGGCGGVSAARRLASKVTASVEVGAALAVMFGEPEGVFFGIVTEIRSPHGVKKASVTLKSLKSKGSTLTVAWFDAGGELQGGAEGPGALYTVGDEATRIEVDNVLMAVDTQRDGPHRVRVDPVDFEAARSLAGAFVEAGEGEENEDEDGDEDDEDDDEGSD